MGGHGVSYRDATSLNGETVSKVILPVVRLAFLSLEWRAGA